MNYCVAVLRGQLWYVGDDKDVNMGYAMNYDSESRCAEEIAPIWEWWDFNSGEMVLDPTAKLDCVFSKE